MRFKSFCISIFAFIALLAASAADTASLPLISPMFGDNMVLLRGKPIRFWGWAKAGELIRVELDGRTADVVANSDGRWQAEIKSPAPGGPFRTDDWPGATDNAKPW